MSAKRGCKVNLRQQAHITDVLIKLHWLPVSSRIVFKIATLAYRCLNNCAPMYLSTLISRREYQSSLDLIVPKTNLVYSGDRSFAKMAPKIWNGIPLSIRQSTSLS